MKTFIKLTVPSPQHQNTSVFQLKTASVSERDEIEIWSRFLDGDDESLIYIYRKYANILFRYANQFSKRHELVRDCIQELFYDLIDKRGRLSPVKSVKAYLFACIKRKLLRKIQKEERLAHEREGFSFELDRESRNMYPGLDPGDYAIIQLKLNELPVKQREVILLHFYEGLGYDEIAEVMGIKIKSARVLTYRALESLQRELTPYKGSLYLLLIHINLY